MTRRGRELALFQVLATVVAPRRSVAQFGCQDQECCRERCRGQGFCCNTDVQTSSNEFISCFQACAMRVAGDSAAAVNELCSKPRGGNGCELTHPVLGTLAFCAGCDDNQPVDDWPLCGSGAVADNEACYAGSGNVWTALGLFRSVMGWLIVVVILGAVGLWLLIGMVRGTGGWKGHPHSKKVEDFWGLVRDGVSFTRGCAPTQPAFRNSISPERRHPSSVPSRALAEV